MQGEKKNIINNCATRPHMQMEVREEIFTLKAGDKRPHTKSSTHMWENETSKHRGFYF